MSKQRIKGTAFESLVLEGFQQRYPDAHRLGLQGAKDKGDIWLPASVPYVVECKNEASYAGKLATWTTEAAVEAANADKAYGIVVAKRKGAGDWPLQYVHMTLETFLGLVP